MKNTLSTIIIWAENKPAALYRILSLFRRKMFNIETVTAGHTETPGISRITITATGDKQQVFNICKNVLKLVHVVKVEDVDEKKLVHREMAMIKVAVAKRVEKLEILELVKHFRARVVNMDKKSLVIEVTGGEKKVDAFYDNLKEFKVIEFVRTGRTALYK